MKRNNSEGFQLLSTRTDTWKYIYDDESDQEFLFNIIDAPNKKMVYNLKIKINWKNLSL
ncbi:MAG: hypothetical protein ACFFEN_12630 [Candidatus Thorarchaeota archaeon]